MNKEKIDKFLTDSREKAILGRKIWIYFEKEYELNNFETIVLLLDNNKESWIQYSVEGMYLYAKSKQIKKILVCGIKNEIISFQIINKAFCDIKNIPDIEIKYFEITEDEKSQILKFYTLYEFTEQLKICSLNLPEGRKGSFLCGHKDITEREVFLGTAFGVLENTI